MHIILVYEIYLFFAFHYKKFRLLKYTLDEDQLSNYRWPPKLLSSLLYILYKITERAVKSRLIDCRVY